MSIPDPSRLTAPTPPVADPVRSTAGPDAPWRTDLGSPQEPPPTRPLPDLPTEPPPDDPPQAGAPASSPDAADAPAAPRTPARDPDEELTRLRADAAYQRVDPDEAIALADQLERTMPAAEARRAVDRRIASGLSVDDARRVLLEADPVMER